MPAGPRTIRLAIGQQESGLPYLTLLDQRIGCVSRQNPPAGDVNHVFVFEPEKAKVVDALRKIRFDNDIARYHTAGNEGAVSTIVPVGFYFRSGANRGHIRGARDRMSTQHVVGGAERVVRTNDL